MSMLQIKIFIFWPGLTKCILMHYNEKALMLSVHVAMSVCALLIDVDIRHGVVHFLVLFFFSIILN